MSNVVRGDEICWLSHEDATESAFLGAMEALRCGLNRRLFLGLFEHESHFARYPVGAVYGRHLDALRGRGNRVLSLTLYLNTDWDSADGGSLLLHPPEPSGVARRVAPLLGTLVVFASATVPHEVLAARRQRFSIAGWFRSNGSSSSRIDPAH